MSGKDTSAAFRTIFSASSLRPIASSQRGLYRESVDDLVVEKIKFENVKVITGANFIDIEVIIR